MCGVAGLFVRGGGVEEAELRTRLAPMCQALARRGPDGESVWTDPRAGVALGHRRLAIVDLSETGDQPMVSRSGRYAIVYNGELYNAAEIAAEIGGPMRGHCDTEVVLEACARWGIEDALPRLAGMFAFALWDMEERTLWLARDRLGIKPLVYGWSSDRLAFASDLAALSAAQGDERRIDPVALAGYLRRGCVPAPHTIYAGIRKLPPGHLMRVPASGDPTLRAWWSMADLPAPGTGPADIEEATDRLETLLRHVVDQHLISDVPLGAFLSGGIDSSAVVALMTETARERVRTFSIGFSDPAYDEASEAAAVAEHLGTEHTELIVEPEQAQAVIPKLAEIYEEPFADASQIPTYLVSELARRHVTVALSGDGGDELFAGYTRHVAIPGIWRSASHLPAPLRRLGGGAVGALSPAALDAIGGALPARLRPRHLGDKLHKAARLWGEPSVTEMYRQAISHWADPSALVDAPEPPLALEHPPEDVVAHLRWLDLVNYLPDDILTKVDRASMAVSLEARVPLLDHRVLEFAWSLPTSTLIRNGRGKQPLRRLLARRMPPALFERPKTGFGLPLGDWLRGPLRDWAEDLIGPKALTDTGLVDPEPVQRAWAAHRQGRVNAQSELWSVLMLQSWARRWGASL